jgi:hypothetical protein
MVQYLDRVETDRVNLHDKSGFVSRPDLVVAHQAAVSRVRRDGGMLRALIDCPLAVESGYQDPGPITGRFATTVLFPVCLSLDRLFLG